MGSAHTPGPWHVVAEQPHLVSDASGGVVADVGSWRATLGEERANGRLIAASPKLLEVAQRAAPGECRCAALREAGSNVACLPCTAREALALVDAAPGEPAPAVERACGVSHPDFPGVTCQRRLTFGWHGGKRRTWRRCDGHLAEVQGEHVTWNEGGRTGLPYSEALERYREEREEKKARPEHEEERRRWGL